MKIQAVICDVYKTLLDVAPSPPDAGDRWVALCRETLPEQECAGLREFSERCEKIIAREHVIAKAAGVVYPEVYWPEVAVEALPGLRSLFSAELEDFLVKQAALFHTVQLMPGAAGALRELARRGILLGIASNAQPYTLHELDTALEQAGLSRVLFLPELTFWSFQHGFSKPNAHVIRLLTARLRCLGIEPGETLMVGDRLDNDIEPARIQGWQTWKFAQEPLETGGGDWAALIGSL